MSTKQRLSASFDAELMAAAQQAVTEGRAESISAWVSDALRLKADHDRRLQALDDFLTAYEAEHGEITDDDMRAAGPSWPSSVVTTTWRPWSSGSARPTGRR